MPASTRISDSTVGTCDLGLECCPHSRSGTNSTGSPDVFINNLKSHRLTDTGPTNCPHSGTFESVEGSPNVFVNGLPKTRITDTTICLNCGQSGNHVSGSQDVFVNGF